MKKLLPIFLLLLGTQVNAQTVYPSGVTNCIARWDFSSSGILIPDVSGNNNDGTAHNIVASKGFRNVPNQALRFNGTNSYIEVPHSNLLQPDAITLVSLVYFHGFYSGLCEISEILSKNAPHNITGVYSIGVSDNAFTQACGVYDPTKMQVESAYNSNAVQTTRLPNDFVQANKWYLLASSYDGDTIKYYTIPMDPERHENNIQPTYSDYFPGELGFNTQSLTIGRDLSVDYPYWLNADLDEIAIFNKVLNRQEMQSVYDYLWTTTLEVKKPNGFDNITSYPNPAQNEVFISGSYNAIEEVTAKIYSVTGQKIMEDKLQPRNGYIQYKVQTSEFTNGLYFIELSANGKSKTIKFAISH